MFECRTCPSLRAQLSDQQDLLLRMAEAHAAERKALIDQLISLASPVALRELRRPPEPLPRERNQSAVTPVRPNFPGFDADLRPKVPIDAAEREFKGLKKLGDL